MIISTSIIARALLKYGYSNFQLEILEYCEPSNCIEREQYYIDLFKPEYNILKKASSPLGYKHSEVAIRKISASLIGNKRSLGRNKPIGSGKSAILLKVFNIETEETKIYPSISEAAKALGVNVGSIRNYLTRKTQTPFKGIFVLEKLQDSN
jgi:NUMOD1 domain